MKNLTVVRLLTGAFAVGALFFAGCSGGGGGGGGQPNPGNQPGAAGQHGINPATIEAGLYVHCKGQVLERLANGQTQPLPGVTLKVFSGGNNVDTAVSDQNGVYHVKLRRAQHNAVRASRAGYVFDPAAVLATPRQAEVLPNLVGAVPAVAQPGGGNNPPAAAQGRVTLRLSGNAASNPLNGAFINVRDASNNDVVMDIMVAGFETVSFLQPVGTELIIRPRSQGNVPWSPASRSVRVTANEQTLLFRWPEPGVRSPAPRPTPRPALRPVARPTPKPLHVPALRPMPTPAPAVRPIRYPVGQ